jgi:hypothetical protein
VPCFEQGTFFASTGRKRQKRILSGLCKIYIEMPRSIESLYPNTAFFVKSIGWIEMGHDDDSPLTSFVRALDIGGMLWEGEDDYPSLDAAFADLESGITEWMEDNGVERG